MNQGISGARIYVCIIGMVSFSIDVFKSLTQCACKKELVLDRTCVPKHEGSLNGLLSTGKFATRARQCYLHSY